MWCVRVRCGVCIIWNDMIGNTMQSRYTKSTEKNHIIFHFVVVEVCRWKQKWFSLLDLIFEIGLHHHSEWMSLVRVPRILCVSNESADDKFTFLLWINDLSLTFLPLSMTPHSANTKNVYNQAKANVVYLFLYYIYIRRCRMVSSILRVAVSLRCCRGPFRVEFQFHNQQQILHDAKSKHSTMQIPLARTHAKNQFTVNQLMYGHGIKFKYRPVEFHTFTGAGFTHRLIETYRPWQGNGTKHMKRLTVAWLATPELFQGPISNEINYAYMTWAMCVSENVCVHGLFDGAKIWNKRILIWKGTSPALRCVARHFVWFRPFPGWTQTKQNTFVHSVGIKGKKWAIHKYIKFSSAFFLFEWHQNNFRPNGEPQKLNNNRKILCCVFINI